SWTRWPRASGSWRVSWPDYNTRSNPVGESGTWPASTRFWHPLQKLLLTCWRRATLDLRSAVKTRPAYWFSDNTKSHHRRWCSVALWGNRHKVAAYRKRRRREGV